MLRNEYAEKRDFMRMSVNSKLKFRTQDGKAMHDGCITDLSGGGMSFVTAVPLDRHARLAVAVESSSRNIPPLVAYVEVVRCDPDPDAETFTVACKIDRIHPADYPDTGK